MRTLALAAALLAPAFSARAQGDVLKRLESDPSPGASRRLGLLLRRTKNSDQRFWLVRALGTRLSDLADEEALEVLLWAAGDSDPGVRASSLRALSGFRFLPKPAADGRAIGRLEAAEKIAAADSSPAVRQAAKELKEALKAWRHSAPAQAAARRGMDGDYTGLSARALCWVWILAVPITALVWAWLRIPIFADSDAGRRARSCWRFLRSRPAYLAPSALGWTLFAGVSAGLGFDLLARLLGDPFFQPLRGWPKDLALLAASLGIPAGLVARTLGRGPDGAEPLAPLLCMPWIALCGVALSAALPAEAAYRLLLRRSGAADRSRGRGSFRWALEVGVTRAASAALAMSGAEGFGIIPALGRARALTGPAGGRLALSCFDPRFVWLGAVPSLSFFSVMFVRPRPIEWACSVPVVLAGCAVWAAAVSGGSLWMVAKSFEAVETAAEALAALGRPSPCGWGPGRGA